MGLNNINALRGNPIGNCSGGTLAEHFCDGTLRIVNNDNLLSFNGIGGLSDIDTEVVVQNNPSLSDATLSGGARAGGPGIVIRNNPQLPRADACTLATGLSQYSDTCLAPYGEATDGGFVFEICGNTDGPTCPDGGS
jgi:hypothetical protein